MPEETGARDIRDVLAEAAAEAETGEAEADQDEPLPPHVKVTRGRADARVLQVALNSWEFDALEAIAARRELPMLTIARAQLLKLISRERIERLNAAIASGDIKVSDIDLDEEEVYVNGVRLTEEMANDLADALEHGRRQEP